MKNVHKIIKKVESCWALGRRGSFYFIFSQVRLQNGKKIQKSRMHICHALCMHTDTCTGTNIFKYAVYICWRFGEDWSSFDHAMRILKNVTDGQTNEQKERWTTAKFALGFFILYVPGFWTFHRFHCSKISIDGLQGFLHHLGQVVLVLYLYHFPFH